MLSHPEKPSSGKSANDLELDALYGPLEAALDESDRIIAQDRADARRRDVPKTAARNIRICDRFKRNRCHRGAECTFSHDLQPAKLPKDPMRYDTSRTAAPNQIDFRPHISKRKHSQIIPDHEPLYRAVPTAPSYPAPEQIIGQIQKRVKNAAGQESKESYLSRQDSIALGKSAERVSMAAGGGLALEGSQDVHVRKGIRK